MSMLTNTERSYILPVEKEEFGFWILPNNMSKHRNIQDYSECEQKEIDDFNYAVYTIIKEYFSTIELVSKESLPSFLKINTKEKLQQKSLIRLMEKIDSLRQLLNSSLEDILTSGGDERLALNDQGVNNFFVSPFPCEETIERSSCTCSSIKKREYEYSQQLLNQLKNGEVIFSDVMSSIHNRIREIFDISDNYSLVTVPSGTDSEYIPLFLAQKIFSGCKKITSIVTGDGEVGKNSPTAASGLYHSKYLPFTTREEKSFKLLKGFSDIDLIKISNRDEESGKPLGFLEEIIEMVKTKIEEEKNYVILHFLECSKLGDRFNDFDKIQHLMTKYHKEIMIVVDCCQTRTDISRIKEYLELGCIVQFTGSKFIQSPPFCAGVIIPPNFQIPNKDVDVPSGISEHVTEYDLSGPISKLKYQMNPKMNFGLMFRWNIAIKKFEQFNRLDRKKTNKLINLWIDKAIDIIKSYDNLFFFSGGEQQQGSVGEVNTILSLKLICDGEFLDYNELRDIYSLMNKDVSEIFLSYAQVDKKQLNALRKSFLIGQPVSLNGINVIRVPIGLNLIIDLTKRDLDDILNEDHLLFMKLSLLAKNYRWIKNV